MFCKECKDRTDLTRGLKECCGSVCDSLINSVHMLCQDCSELYEKCQRCGESIEKKDKKTRNNEIIAEEVSKIGQERFEELKDRLELSDKDMEVFVLGFCSGVVESAKRIK